MRTWLVRPGLIWMGLSAVLLGAGALPSPWASWEADPCRAVNCVCERLGAGAVAQPVAAHSNLGFVLVGLLVGAAPDPAGTRWYRRVFGAAALAAGLGSWFYHASLTRAGEWFDILGLYALTGALLWANLARLRRRPGGPRWLAGYLVSLAGLGGQMAVARELQLVIFAALIAATLLTEAVLWLRGDRPRHALFLAAGLASFGSGAAAWLWEARLPCDPAGLWQWHAVWHALAALAVALLFVYYDGNLPGAYFKKPGSLTA